MATLTPLKPDGFDSGTIVDLRRYSRSGGSWSEGAQPSSAQVWGDLDEAVTSSAADGDTGIGLKSGANIENVPVVSVTNVNADFQSMDTLAFHYSTVDFATYSDDDAFLRIRIRNSANTATLAAFESSGTYQVMDQFTSGVWTITTNGGTGTAPAYNKSNTFGYVNTTATKADWDGATVWLYYGDSRNMGSDNAAIVLVDFELTGTYTPTTPGRRPQHIWLPAGNRINAHWY